MTHIAYVNSQYVDHQRAMTHIEDRGYQFADGVYDYIAFYNQTPLDEAAHLARLERSLRELSIDPGSIVDILPIIIRELIARNKRQDGAIYVQVSRGIAKRDHPFPAHAKPSLVVVVRGSKMPNMEVAKQGVSVITLPDIRWGRCDIKSISLLANILAKQQAVESGAKEAWLYKEDGTVTEGAASNAFIVKSGVIHTHPKTEAILPGITRDEIIKLANKLNINIEEKAFTIQNVKSADEAFLASTSFNVQPIVVIDGQPVGNGKLGPVSEKLMTAFAEKIHRETGKIW